MWNEKWSSDQISNVKWCVRRMSWLFFICDLIFAIFLLAGCCPSEPPDPTTPPTAVPVVEPTAEPVASPLADFFPSAGVIPGWTLDGELEAYDSETIFALVNGQADFFFVYGFEQVAVRRYKNAEDVPLDVQIWQVADPEGAYGLYTASRAGDLADVGNEGDTDPGRRLIFWQASYVVELFARKTIPDTDLLGFGEALSAALPAGGESPALVERLPADGLVERSAIFFYDALSIQTEVWLGGENVLGLSRETGGVIARYELDSVIVRLMLVEYPDAGAASAALTALEGGEVSDLAGAGAQDNLLGAVFGQVDEASGRALLEAALE
jgi:hypothetical protein